MKWLKWCGQLLLTVMLVSTLTLLTTGLIVQSYVNSLLASFNIAWEGQPSGLSSIFQGALGMNSDTSSGSEEQQKETSTDNTSTGSTPTGQNDSPSTGSNAGKDAAGTRVNGDQKEDPVNSGTVDKKDEGSGTSSQNSGDTNEASGTSADSNEGGGGTDDPVIMSPDEMANYKDTISNKEKTEVFDLLMTKIPTDEMQVISSTMENGITEQELQDMEQVIAKYLTEEEYKQLMAILTPEQ